MSFKKMLDTREITIYRLSRDSGVAKTTLADIYAGRSSIMKCSAGTVYQIAKALNCTMEEIVELDISLQQETKTYLECGLPDYLRESVVQMKAAWEKLDQGVRYTRWDCDFCNLQTDINIAETSNAISAEQAWYLREKYLRIERS